jgi:prevent-host-death family protein
MQAPQKTEASISVDEAKRDLEKIVQHVAESSDSVTIEVDGEPKVVMVTVATYLQLQQSKQRARERAAQLMQEAAARANMSEEDAEALAAEAVMWARDNKEA